MSMRWRDPEHSSCMTNKFSLQGSRFRSCDMQFLKANNMECRKDYSFAGHFGYDREKCKKFWQEATYTALDKLAKLLMPQTNKEKLLKSSSLHIKGFHIKDGKRAYVDECVDLRTLPEYGWCEILKFPWDTKPLWGLCSKSCKLVKVELHVYISNIKSLLI